MVSHLTKTQRKAYRIADNRSALDADWDEGMLSAEIQDLLAEDFDLSLTGFDDTELDSLMKFQDGESIEEPEVVAEPPAQPVSRTGDLWILGDHRLLCGDATNHDDVRTLMDGERAVLFATAPPYLVKYTGKERPRDASTGKSKSKDWSATYRESEIDDALYENFIAAAIAEAITENAAWYCWHADRRQKHLEECWESAGAKVHQTIIWVKNIPTAGFSEFRWQHEPCFFGWCPPNRPKRIVKITIPSTIWPMDIPNWGHKIDHPTVKPLDAFGIPMRQHCPRGGLCYEPFSGSGSQIMAGEANGRRVFAMEISAAYVDVAVERWQAATGREAHLVGQARTFAEVKNERLSNG